MLKGLSFLALPLLLLASPAHADSTLYLNSQTGDLIGGGQQLTFTSAQGGFSASPVVHGFQINYNQSNPTHSWTLDFTSPTAGGGLAPGVYDQAQRYPIQGPLYPGLSVSGDGHSCNSLTGRFVVRDIATDVNGNLTTFAADFEQHCEGAAAALFGSIRYNSSVPIPYPDPTADAGIKQLVLENSSMTLDGSLSTPGDGASITSYQWDQLSGTPVTLSDVTAVQPTFTAPDESLGGEDLVFQLTVTDSNGHSDTATVTVHVADAGDPVTLFTVTSDPGNAFNITTFALGPVQATFTTAKAVGGSDGVRININGGQPNHWGVTLAAPQGLTLQTGTYDGAQGYPFQALSLPGIDFSGNSHGCNNESGHFAILDLQKDGNGNVTSLAADFDQHCENQPAANHGKIRINSTVPLDAPVTDILPVQVMPVGETVTLDASSWSTGTDGDDIVSYQWTQLSGPSVTLSDPAGSDPTFVAPDVGAGGADLVFQLTITNSLGLSSTSSVTVHVASPDDALTLLDQQPGIDDALYASGHQVITSAQMTFVSQFSSGGVDTRIGGFLPGSIDIQAYPPFSQTVAPGLYHLSQLNGLSGFSNFAMTGNSMSCRTDAGRFAILDLETSNNLITSLALDYELLCDKATLPAHGKLRVNSTVPLDTPVADPGTNQDVNQGDLVHLTGDTSDAGGAGDTMASYQWTQLSGPAASLSDSTAADPTITAPAVPPGGADLVYQLTVTNSNALTNSASMTVHVAHPGDPFTVLKLDSDAGDLLGKGQHLELTHLNSAITLANIANMGLELKAQNAGGINSSSWSVDLSAPLARPLQVGAYDQAMNYDSFFVSGAPGLSTFFIGPSGSSCAHYTGYFVVLDIQRDANNNVSSLAVDFEQHCNGAAAALRGKIRYNSAIPLDQPFADPGPLQVVDEGGTVTLGGTGSFGGDGDAAIVSYQWVQLSGPVVLLSDPTAADPSFTAPDVGTGGADLVFQVTVTNSDGLSTVESVTIHVGDPNDPKTVMYFAGVTDESADPDHTVTLSPLNAQFSISAQSSNTGAPANKITVSGDQGVLPSLGEDVKWTLLVQAPNNQSLQAGHVYPVQNFFFTSTDVAGLELRGVTFCGDVSGQFRIRDLKLDQNGNVTSFAADIVQICDDEPPAIYGWIRYNSTVPLQTPIAQVSPDQTTYAGFPVALDGGQSVSGRGSYIASYQWTQIVASGDPVATLSGGDTARPGFAAPDVPLGGKTLRFRLTVTGSTGLTDSAVVKVTDGNQDDFKSVFAYHSDPDDPVGAGTEGLVQNGQNGFVEGHLFPNAAMLEVGRSDSDTFGEWMIDFDVLDLAGLRPGVYLADGVMPFPSMLVKSVATCDTPKGAFIVRDAEYSTQGQLVGLGVDIVQQCSGASGVLEGAIRLRSKAPTYVTTPKAIARPTQKIATPGTVTLDGSLSFPGWKAPLSYRWVQTGGPGVTLEGTGRAVAHFTMPSKYFTQPKTLAFRLTVTNTQGLSDSTSVRVSTGTPTDNTFTLQSATGDSVAHGQNVSYDLDDKSVDIGTLKGNLVKVDLRGVAAGWRILLDTPNGQPLAAGSYPDTLLPSPSPGPSPGLSVSFRNRACRKPIGDYDVLEVHYAADGSIDVLALDFDQHCDGSTAGLHGRLRYHSSMP